MDFIKNNTWLVVAIALLIIVIIIVVSVACSKSKKKNKNNINLSKNEEVTNEDLAIVSSQVIDENPELQNLDVNNIVKQ